MSVRFRCSDPLAGDFEFADVEEVLDALEAALVAPDTPMLDTARQSWQPVALHPEVRVAWQDRSRYRPPGSTGLALPELPAVAAMVRGEGEEAAGRRAAYARVRQLPVREEIPAGDRASPRRPRALLLVLAGVAAVLGLIGWAVVVLGARLSALAARAAGLAR